MRPALRCDRLRSQATGRERYLQVIAAGVSIHIQYFSGEKKALNQLGFHCFGVYLPDLNPAGGDDCLVQGTKPLDFKRNTFNKSAKPPPLLPGNRVAF